MDGDKEVTYVYSKNPAKYTLTVNYVDEAGAELSATVTEIYTEGEAYETTAEAIEGYTFQHTTGDAASGTMDGNKEVTYVYGKIVIPEIVVDPVEPPVAPADPVDPPVDPMDPPVIDIPDEDVPLADVPKTGDPMTLWILAAVFSALGLAWLALTEKKRSAMVS